MYKSRWAISSERSEKESKWSISVKSIVTDMKSIHSEFIDSLHGAEGGPTKFEGVSLKT